MPENRLHYSVDIIIIILSSYQGTAFQSELITQGEDIRGDNGFLVDDD